MRKVLPLSRIGEMEPDMDARVLRYIHEGQIEAFEGFEDFDLIAFDWYDVRSERTAASQMLLYLDREDLFVFCEDEAALGAAQGVFRALEEEGTITNQQALCHFFTQLLRGDMDHLVIWSGSSPGGGSCCGSSGTMSSWTPSLMSCP